MDELREPDGMQGVTDLSSVGSGRTIGTLIRMLRQQQGMTQESLAAALGVGRSAVALWETDRGGATSHIVRIAEVLGAPPEMFLNGMTSHSSFVSVTVDEMQILLLYRTCGVSERIRIRQSMENLSKAR